MGAGRPLMPEEQRRLSGRRMSKEGRSRRPKAVVAEPLPPVVTPEDMASREQAVWEQLAPLALAARTLVPGTAGDLKALCTLEVEMAEVLAARRLEGWTALGISLERTYLQLVQRVEAKRRGFKLAPMGKDMVPPEVPKDEWSEFDAPVQ